MHRCQLKKTDKVLTDTQYWINDLCHETAAKDISIVLSTTKN